MYLVIREKRMKLFGVSAVCLFKEDFWEVDEKHLALAVAGIYGYCCQEAVGILVIVRLKHITEAFDC